MSSLLVMWSQLLVGVGKGGKEGVRGSVSSEVSGWREGSVLGRGLGGSRCFA